MKKALNYLKSNTICRVSKQQNLRNALRDERLKNKELATICQRQQLLIDEQSGMIVEMLEGMGR